MEMIILFQLSLRFAAKDSASNTPALAPVRVCCQAGDKPLSEPMMTQCIDVPWNIWYKSHQIPKLKCFPSCLAIVFAQSIEARLSREWRCSWSIDRRCSGYIWGINNLLPTKVHKGFTVCVCVHAYIHATDCGGTCGRGANYHQKHQWKRDPNELTRFFFFLWQYSFAYTSVDLSLQYV